MFNRPRLALPFVLLAALAVLPAARPDDPKPTAPGPKLSAVVPGDVTAFASLDVAKVWDHKSFLGVREARGKLEFAWAVQSLVGVAPVDLARVTAFWHPSVPGSPFVLVTGRKKLDTAAMVKLLARPGAKAPAAKSPGKVLVAPGAEFVYLLPLDAKTVLLAPPAADPAKLEQLSGKAGPLAAAVKEAGNHTLTVGLDVKSIAALPLPVGGPLLEADTAVLTADVSDENVGKAQLRLAFATPEKAKRAGPFLKTKLDELAGWASAQEKRATAKGQVGTGYPAPLLEWIATTLKGTAVKADGPVVTASTTVKLDEAVSRVMMAVPDSAFAMRGSTAAENNVKQIGLAMHNYESAIGHFPSNSYDKDGRPLLSWRVHILPYIEQAAVYQQFKLDEPWDSPHNKPLGQLVIRVFQVPGRPAPQPWETYFRTFIGPKDVKGGHRPWLVEGDSNGPKIAQVTDGTSNTFMVVEAAEAVPWAKPDDLPYDGVLPLPKLGGPNGVYVAGFADGSTRTFRRGQIDETNMRRLISLADGNTVDIPRR
jgi:hypothetical protein